MSKQENVFSRRQILEMTLGLSGLALTGGVDSTCAQETKQALAPVITMDAVPEPIGNEGRGEESMPMYLTRFSYTPETWAKLIKKPEDRRAAAKQYIESVGGKLHGFWYAFGEHEGYNLWEAPDNVAMAATAISIEAGGALSSIQTTDLLTVEETISALKKASSITYRPPGK
jgi:uncharacterized protein with GYD domain